ncbi:MAG: glutaredoxin family protein [Bacillota bacterium]|nr:glutaredoxin family protein [Bacillota bacterium]MDW7682838.1 glutaredoxin family protein [Bacillota bacterium]
MSQLLIYTKTGCPYCKAALEKYQKDGVDFREINTSEDPQALQYIKETFNAKQVPVIVRDGELVEIGFQGGG